MQPDFVCPHCNTFLNSDNKTQVLFRGILQGENFSVTFPISVPAELGVYGGIFPDYIVLQEGAIVEFHCPHCNYDLTSPDVPDHAAVKMVLPDSSFRVVTFNRVFGKHSSFIYDIASHKVVESYGEHQNQYSDEFNHPINFFGV